jgi:ribonuclease BN (tRNA processing enzyme)
MKVRILGAHNIDSANVGCPAYVIDDILAVDAGSLTYRLTLEEQLNLKAIFLTHQHYDHTQSIPLLGMTLFIAKQTTEVYATEKVQTTLTTHMLNGELYPDFSKLPKDKPIFHFNTIEPGKAVTVAGYNVLPVAVNHSVPTVGFHVTAFDGKSIFITSDTGPGLEECWKAVSPNLLLIETTVLNEGKEFARHVGHLTPALLQKELESFRDIKGYIPEVVLMHMNPLIEKELKAEIRQVEKALKIKIKFGREGMTLKI